MCMINNIWTEEQNYFLICLESIIIYICILICNPLYLYSLLINPVHSKKELLLSGTQQRVVWLHDSAVGGGDSEGAE